jgi:protease-4
MLLMLLVFVIVSGGCAPRLFKTSADPLREFTIEGKADEKVLLIPLRGEITNRPDQSFFRTRPSKVQEIVSHLRKAQKDPKIKAVLLQIESPGGSVSASDILFHELEKYKEKSGAKVVTLMMGIALSGGYYVALASDRIIAHPMSVTGSVGTIFIRPNAKGLMDKVGIGAEVIKSGRYKDMGSPFREGLPEEKEMLQAMIEDLNSRFLKLAVDRRTFTDEQYGNIASARIFTAKQALDAGLIDSVGYMDDALNETKRMAALPDDARLVVYRRTHYPDDNPYNLITMEGGSHFGNLITLPFTEFVNVPETGFYYLWLPQYEN